MNKGRSSYVAQAGMIAAVYAAATLVALLLLQGLAWGPVQFRISEAVCVLAVLTPAAVPGLTVGCIVANLIALAVNGTGALGLLDVVFGSLATFLGALWCWKMRERPKLALLGPVIANAVVVPAYLPLLLQGLASTPFRSRASRWTVPTCPCTCSAWWLPASARRWSCTCWACRCFRRSSASMW